jgi:hypothetical protein
MSGARVAVLKITSEAWSALARAWQPGSQARPEMDWLIRDRQLSGSTGRRHEM